MRDDASSVATARDGEHLRSYAPAAPAPPAAAPTAPAPPVAAPTPPEPKPTFLAKVNAKLPKPLDENEVIANSIVKFLEANAQLHSLDPEQVYYSFLVGFVEHVARINTDHDDLFMGDLAPLLASYQIMASHVMSQTDLRGINESFERILVLCRALDAKLRFREPVMIEMTGTAGSFVASRLAARCAIPFTFGYARMLRDDKLEFTLRALLRREDKVVTHVLSYLRDEEDLGDELRPRLTAAALTAHLRRCPLPAAALHGIGYHSEDGAHYETAPQEDYVQRVKYHMGAVPPARGSILRAYVRATHGIRGDDLEPDMQHMHDCVLR